MNGPVANASGCATPGQYALSIGTRVGAQVYKVILTGHVQNFSITVYGTRTRSVSGCSEDIKYVWFDSPMS